MNKLKEISFRKLKRTYNESYKITEKIIKLADKREDFAFGLEDKVLIGFFEEVLRATKSIIILLNADHPSSIITIVRKIFENRLYIQYLIDQEEDIKIRARSYYLNYYKNSLNMANSIVQKNKIGMEIRQEFGINTQDLYITEEFIEEKFDMIKNDFCDVLQLRKMKDAWYNLDKKTNTIEKLALKLKMRPHYELFYRLYSQDTHSSNSMKVMQATSETDELDRNLIYITKHKEEVGDIYLSTSVVINYITEISETILMHYGMEKELRSYRRNINLIV